ncbi:hypothetical protein GCM10023188_12470 [Pontibacter saemangeumensis]|uniref:DUF349 domain-containing protein n=2 Tax=Pontibacter saemangeumensis TaxID=1084525 RepID=A0ABP8LGD4_9BACT
MAFLLTLMISMISLGSCTTTRESEVGDELSDFRNWVSRETSQLANRTEEDWQQTKEDFRTRTQELDQKQEQFSAELKEEYKQLKQEFTEADESYRKARTEARMAEWEGKLLGQWADTDTINAANVRDAYITFMENVRTLKSGWSNDDWDMAKMVLQQLNDRKEEINADIDTDSEVKIKALQMEFLTLETAADVGGN